MRIYGVGHGTALYKVVTFCFLLFSEKMVSELTECTWCSLLPYDFVYTHCISESNFKIMQRNFTKYKVRPKSL